MKSEARKKKIRFDKVMSEQYRMQLAGEICEKLRALYPGYVWEVTVEQGGIIQVVNRMISTKMGFVLHVAKLDPEFKTVMRYGGELLERYNQRRGWADEAAIITAKRDIRGNMYES